MAPLDVVKEAWRSWEDRDIEAVVTHLRPDVVHDLSHYAGWPHEPRHQGIGEALASLGDWMNWWHGYRQDLVDFETSANRVLALMRHRGRRDGREVVEDLALLFYVGDDDRITEWQPWSDVDAARAAMRTVS
jgi:limonene-1,2-epoxide hydrolase